MVVFCPAPNVGVIYLFSADSAPCIFVNIGELDSYYQETGQNSELEFVKLKIKMKSVLYRGNISDFKMFSL